MKHKCDGCEYKGQHQEMMFRPMGVCTKEPSLECAVRSYNAEKCPHKRTNYDRIKGKSVEEMADFLMDWFIKCSVGQAPMNVKNWLESEVEE